MFCWRQGQGPEQSDSDVEVCPAWHRVCMTWPSEVPSKLSYSTVLKQRELLSLGQCFPFEQQHTMQSKINNYSFIIMPDRGQACFTHVPFPGTLQRWLMVMWTGKGRVEWMVSWRDVMRRWQYTWWGTIMVSTGTTVHACEHTSFYKIK